MEKEEEEEEEEHVKGRGMPVGIAAPKKNSHDQFKHMCQNKLLESMWKVVIEYFSIPQGNVRYSRIGFWAACQQFWPRDELQQM